jgi:hypothetical protein
MKTNLPTIYFIRDTFSTVKNHSGSNIIFDFEKGQEVELGECIKVSFSGKLISIPLSCLFNLKEGEDYVFLKSFEIGAASGMVESKIN